MKKITDKLEEIAHSAKNPSEQARTVEAIKNLRKLIEEHKVSAPAAKELLERLNGELDVWQSKISVILKEPVGREGMARHAKHWVQELGKLHG